MKKRNFSWMNPKLEVRDTKKYGKGVFAMEDIEKGETCAIFGGHVISFKEEAKLPKEYKDTGILIHDNFVISTLNNKEDTDNFNHSCEPNAGIKGQIFLVAMKNIKIHDQVTFDYAMCLSYSKEYSPYYYDIKCLCGEKKCRGRITADDWKLPTLQEKYSGYFQYYIQQKIDLGGNDH